MQQLTAKQKANAKYESKFIKVTVRVDPQCNRQLTFLTQQHGSQNKAIEYALNHAYVGDRLHKDNAHQLEVENGKLAGEVEELRIEIAALKRQKYTPEEDEQLLEIALEEWERRQKAGYFTPAIENQFLAFETAQDEII